MADALDNFTLTRGQRWQEVWTFYDDDDGLWDFTDWHAAIEFRVKTGASADLRIDDQSTGGITLGGVLGTLTIDAEDDLTQALGRQVYEYDLCLVDPAGEPDYPVGGKVTIKPHITEPAP